LRGILRSRKVFKQHGELVATQTSHRITSAYTPIELPRYADEYVSPLSCPSTSLTALKPSRSYIEHGEAKVGITFA
jgi:hypothetical protein